jgi:hypothetical protein
MFLSSLSEIIVSTCLSYKIGTFAKESVETEGETLREGIRRPKVEDFCPNVGFLAPSRQVSCYANADFCKRLDCQNFFLNLFAFIFILYMLINRGFKNET